MKNGTLTVQEWVTMVAGLAGWEGWSIVQINKSTSDQGAPHLVIVKEGRCVAVWVKAERSKLTDAESAAQLVWSSFADCETWRQPDRDRIKKVLAS